MNKYTIKFVGRMMAILLILGAVLSPAAGINSQDWPQFRHSSQHTGSSSSSAPDTANLVWDSGAIGAQEGSSVSAAEGKLFVNCVSNLSCLDKETGKILWSTAFNPLEDICQAFGFSPAYHQGRVFLSGQDTLCLNASDGRVLWKFTPPTKRGALDGGPAVSDGFVLVSDWDGHHYYCLDEDTGAELWNFTVEGNAQSVPAIDKGRVIFSGWDWGLGGKIYCVDLKDGFEIWNLTTKSSPCGSAAIWQDVAYFTTYNFEGDGDVMAVSLPDGQLIWEKAIKSTDCTPALSEGLLYVCGGTDGFSDKITYCFNATNGELIWNTTKEDGIGEWRCSPAYADGLLFVGKTECSNSAYNTLCAINASTGDTVWSYPAGGSAPVIVDGMVFSIGAGSVYAFGPGGNAT
jgi:outer membrane protein assembly factor BamB